MRFVLVNNRILDFDLYREEFAGQVRLFKSDLFELARANCLVLSRISKASDFRQKFVFFNNELDLELVVILRKKSEPEFV